MSDAKLIDRIQSLSPRRRDLLMRALQESKDAKSIRKAAHALKSSAANLGAAAMAELLKQIEEKARANQLAETARIIDEVQQMHPQVCDELAAIREEEAA